MGGAAEGGGGATVTDNGGRKGSSKRGLGAMVDTQRAAAKPLPTEKRGEGR